jgi:hypothetical protein
MIFRIANTNLILVYAAMRVAYDFTNKVVEIRAAGKKHEYRPKIPALIFGYPEH